ncbi:peptide synthase [Alcanivorax sp. S71-1-4]|uniref:non-ribosomal peptide synthetase n=1 Tax=Alcanivorax sp. S71-1-4 TaxID=1177159 RepID=UPI0013582D8E|nr:non-ribosomal peptide synthetase [Alcanivorax sp. S71-1-4]KAF0809374.1 peptide synthase [Alcanivorax sp. S71-1-4]
MNAALRTIAERFARLPGHKQRDFLAALQQQGIDFAQLPMVPRADDGPCPLSFAQARQWFLWRLDPAGTAYHISGALTLTGPLDVVALRAALATLVARHAALRTRFIDTEDGHALQACLPEGEVSWQEETLADPSLARARAEAIAAAPFDLRTGPLLRAVLLRTGEKEQVLVLVVHHIVADGWSMQILLHELMQCYAAGGNAALPLLPVSYADYALWQRHALEAGERARQLAYWRAELGGAQPVLQLPADAPRRAGGRYTAARHTVHLPASLINDLRGRLAGQGATLFMALLAAFQVLLSRRSGLDDIRVGVPLANRQRTETEGVIGFFVNTQVLRARLAPGMTLNELVQQVRATTLAAQSHQDLPFEELVDALHPARSLDSSPLFQVAFDHQQQGEAEQASLPGVTVGAFPLRPRQAQFELALATLAQADGSVAATFTYAQELFEADTVAALAAQYEVLVTALVQTPDAVLGDLPLLTTSEQQTLTAWGQPPVNAPAFVPAHHRISEQARQRPEADALITAAGTLSYAALDAQANALAHQLMAAGVRAETRVGVALPRDAGLIIALLAIHRAGGAYVPLDPQYPADRLRYMMEDSGMRLLLTTDALLPSLPVPEQVRVLRREQLVGNGQVHAPGVTIHPEQLAYLIYTSGSTGQPKGVAVAHGPFAMHVQAISERYGMTPQDRELQFASVCFDGAHERIWVPLTSGAALMPRDDALWPVTRTCEEIARHGITIACFTPGYLRQIAELVGEPASRLPIRSYTVGGEAMPRGTLALVQQVLKPPRILNGYGPTETVVTPTLGCAFPDSHCTTSAMTIGTPVGDRSAWVLDDTMQPVPPGQPGELYLGGSGLARGYLGRPALSAERFVADPFSDHGARLYRTGDRVRWLPDGTLDYLGRIDQQVKVRGFRIEPGEVEAQLLAQPAVRDAAVMACDAPGGTALVAWVSLQDDSDAARLRAALGETLPDYMVPAVITVLEALPLNANGKVDRQALPAPVFASEQPYEAPQGDIEQMLAHLWQQVLLVEKVGRADNFFDLGGDSILSLQIVARCQQAGWQITPRQMFECQTIAALAAVAEPVQAMQVESERATLRDLLPAELCDTLTLDETQIEDVYPLSPTQEGMLFHSMEERGMYINQLSIAVEGLDAERLAHAWRAMLARHPILRSSVLWQPGMQRPLQLVWREAEADIRQLDWRGKTDIAQALADCVAQDLNAGFDWQRPGLSRLTLIRTGEDAHQLIWTRHHLLADGWADARLLGEWLRAYAGETLPPPPPGYGDYIRWLQRQDQDTAKAFWQGELAGQDGATLLAATATAQPRAGFERIYTRWDSDVTARLQTFARGQQITMNTLVQAAWALVLQGCCQREHVMFGATVAGRPAALPGAQEMVGLFINTLPVPVNTAPQQTVGDYLRTVQHTNLQLREFEYSALADVQRWAGAAGRPLFDSILVFENHPLDEALRDTGRYGLRFGAMHGEGLTGYAMDVQVQVDDTLEIEYCYSRAAFSDDEALHIRARMEQLLDALSQNAARPLGELPRIGAAAMQQLAAWGSNPPAARDERTVTDLIAERATQQPHALAVSLGDSVLDFATLDAEAHRMAQRLRARGIGTETLVGVSLPRSPWLLVTLLGILRAGAAYVPLDSALPAERRAFMVRDSGLRALITTEALRAESETLGAPAVWTLEDVLQQEAPATPLVQPLHPQQLAYMIYTSGSTGLPKGVTVTHGPLAMHCRAVAQVYDMPPGSRELHFMSFSFDGAHERWLAALCQGVGLILREDDLWTAEQTSAVLREQQVDAAAFPPAYLGQLAQWHADGTPPPPVSLYVFGGEAMPTDTLARIRDTLRPRWLLNGYGPTETVVTPLIWKVPAETDFSTPFAPIGRVVGERSAWILDDAMQPVPAGAIGELYIGGYGLARGYAGRAALTASRFVADPFSHHGGRLYRTGDLARWLPDGQVEYLGRADRQVKVRGFRIEPGEIEALLRELPTVRDAAVDVHEGQLVAWLESDDDDSRAARAHLAARLPDYMVPAQCIHLPALPRLISGKLDRHALPAPVATTAAEYVAPRSDTEQQLADIWQQVLGVPRVGITDHFFELGGDSILSLQVISRVRQAGVPITVRLRDLMRYPTIAALVEQAGHADVHTAEQPSAATLPTGPAPLTPIQAWLFEENIPERDHFNQSVLLRAETPLDEDVLREVIARLVAHHDGLRMRLRPAGEGAWQQAPVEQEDSAGILWVRDAASADDILRIGEAAQRSLSLQDGPVMRVVYLRMADQSSRLLIVIHHLFVDGVSWRVLLEDMQGLYQALSAGNDYALPPRSAPFSAWAHYLSTRVPALQSEADYWHTQLQGVADIPRDHDSLNLTGADHSLRCELDDTLTAQLLREAPAAYDTSIDDLLLAALARTVWQWSGEHTTLVNLEGHGREGDDAGLDLSRTVGWFTSVYPLRLVQGQAAPGPLIRAVKNQRRAVPGKGIGYGVLWYLGDQTARDKLGAVSPRITFNYLGQFDQSFSGDGDFQPALESAGRERSDAAPLANWLEIVGHVYGQKLTLNWIFSRHQYEVATVERLVALYEQALRELVTHCVEKTAGRRQRRSA